MLMKNDTKTKKNNLFLDLLTYKTKKNDFNLDDNKLNGRLKILELDKLKVFLIKNLAQLTK